MNISLRFTFSKILSTLSETLPMLILSSVVVFENNSCFIWPEDWTVFWLQARKFKEWLSTIQPISTKLKIGSYPHIIEHKRDHDMWCLKSRYRLDYLKSMIIKSPKQRLETYCFCSVSCYYYYYYSPFFLSFFGTWTCPRQISGSTGL
jgi:hypothetical protein